MRQLQHAPRRTRGTTTPVPSDGDGAGSGRSPVRLAADETGAQAAEYAMLGGVSAAACGGLVLVFQTSDILSSLVDTVIGTLGNLLTGWF